MELLERMTSWPVAESLGSNFLSRVSYYATSFLMGAGMTGTETGVWFAAMLAFTWTVLGFIRGLAVTKLLIFGYGTGTLVASY